MTSTSQTSKSLAQVLSCVPSVGIDFGYCGVHTEHVRAFTISNPTSSVVQYEAVTENCPFELSPIKGTLAQKQKQEIKITFNPTQAQVIIASALIKVKDLSTGNEETKVLKMSAIGKYPFITISHTNVDFEELLIGKTMEKTICVQNFSQVPAKFEIERINDDNKDTSFSLNSYSEEILPSKQFDIKIKYTPTLADVKSITHYRVAVNGGNEVNFTSQGLSLGYDVKLSSKSIHFGEVQIQSCTNRLLNIVNNSDLPTSFQFYNDQNNVFSFSKTCGIVNAHSSTRIIINFLPQKTVNYYERVFCVVRNHQMLSVDLVGTCFDILTKPIPLMQRHVDIYRHKVIMGIHNRVNRNKDGEEIDPLDTVGGADSITHSVLLKGSQHSEFDAQMETNQEIPIDDPSQVVLHKELLQDAASEVKEIKMNASFLDFSFSESGRLSDPKALTMDNKFPFEVQVNWELLQVKSKTTGQLVNNPFRVVPAQTTIPANESMTFNVEFAPFEPDSYFFQIAQCFVHLQNGNSNKSKKVHQQTLQGIIGGGTKTNTKKANENKTLLGSLKESKYQESMTEELDPPMCMNLRLVGHSFPPGSQPFIPMIKITPQNKVFFPPCGPNESVYQTVQINNTSDTPVYFKILQDSTKTFRVFPQIGLIEGKSFQIVCMEFHPKTPRFYNFTAQCIFNHSSSNIQNIHLIGHCYQPSLTLSNNNKLFYPPTYVGVSSKQKVTVKNESRIPVEYEWKVPEKYRREVQCQPSKAILQPNEQTKILVTFTPLKKKEYIVNIPVYAINIYDHLRNMVGFVNPGSGVNQKAIVQQATKNQQNIFRYNLEIVGAGSDGNLKISPKNLDFGTITVGFSKTLHVQITNTSSTNLYVEMKMQQTDKKSQTPEMTKILQDCFKFDTPKGIINAKSKKKVSIIFKPTVRFDFNVNLVCISKEKISKDLAATLSSTHKRGEIQQEKASINIHANGDYPLLRFTDIRNDQVSIANLWERYGLTSLNKELLTPLNDAEIQYNNAEKSNTSMSELQKDLKQFTWDFGKVPIKYGTKPRKITLTVKNVGGVDAEWWFKMPNDNEIELEPWADPGEPTLEQSFEKHILDNQIFLIEPRKGFLKPGEQTELCVYYYPKEVQKHYLKIFLQIMNGKPLIINFVGETLQRRAQLQLLKDTYYLPPVPVGIQWNVTYPIEIKNLGITKLKYQIDTTALEKLNQDNYDFRIFEIQNPEGTLMANETQYIYTLFLPLESKEYSLDLPIKISDIEGPSPEQYVLKLRGNGYHLESEKPQEIQFYEDLPKCRAHLNESGSMAAFSTESIDFGELEAGEPARRFVILYNLHPTQKLKFDFFKSGLMCGDNIRLEPMSAELKPNSHLNIKMTLIPDQYPSHFEGEIQCSIEWESEKEDVNKQEMRSVHTNTNINDSQEFLFLRLKKRSKITKMSHGVEHREGESMFENIFVEAIHEVLDSDEIDKILDGGATSSNNIYEMNIDNQKPPTCQQVLPIENPDTSLITWTEYYEPYEQMIKEVQNMSSEEIEKKRLSQHTGDLIQFMLEDTLFNLMEEATYEEFDLTQAPRIYIQKDKQKK